MFPWAGGSVPSLPGQGGSETFTSARVSHPLPETRGEAAAFIPSCHGLRGKVFFHGHALKSVSQQLHNSISSTACLPDVKAIFRTGSSQYRPALRKQRGLTNSWGWDPCAGQAPAEWLAFKVLIRFLITAKYFKLPKL